MKRFEIHAHSDRSNIRLIDSINTPIGLIKQSLKYGLSGITLTDHEVLSGHVEFLEHYNKVKDENPEFKIGLGNEIYLINDRHRKQKYFHFLLIAKNDIGHRALRELSSIAWYNSYHDSGMERVPTLVSELESVINKYPNSLIATTACLGGQLPQLTLQLLKAEHGTDEQEVYRLKSEIHEFIMKMKTLFGDDFYIEVAPGQSHDQLAFNKKVVSIAEAYSVKMVIGSDAHFLRKEDRFIHKSYLNSKQGEREVDDFYEFSYLMTDEEIYDYLEKSYKREFVEWMIDNSLEIRDKIEGYVLFRDPVIPIEEVAFYPRRVFSDLSRYKSLSVMLNSDEVQDRYWVNSCIKELTNIDLMNDEYLERLNTEAEVLLFISEKLNQPLTAYFNTLQSYINIFWESGSIVGPGRGSAVGFLSNFLLGITQLDPIKYDLPWFRFLNKERAELPDIDIDLAPSKRPIVFKRLREQKGELNVIQVATFGTEGTKSAILTSCRGYRTAEFPEGIDVDTAQYLTSLIPSHRGFLWPLKDVVYGNAKEDRKPIRDFIREVDRYPGLLDIMTSIEGLINKRSQHASGVILYNNNPFETSAIMRSPSGDITTQFSLHDAEKMGDTKFDFLVTEISDKIITCLDFLKEDGLIEDLPLREAYNKYLHPESLNLDDDRLWNALSSNSVLDTFQFSTPVGASAAKIIKPKNVFEMTAANALMRLMGEKGAETPLDKYARFKNDPQEWQYEMDSYGLSQRDQKVIRKYYEKDYGVPPYQESVMLALMDKEICDFSLGESNAARKIIAKKDMSKIPALKEMIFEKGTSERAANYLWKTCVEPQLGYSFSILHSLAYSFVGIQTLFLGTSFPAVYWNAACLVVNAGVVNIEEEDEIELETEDIEDEEAEDNARDKKKKTKSTDYAKLAMAMNTIIENEIEISKPDINLSSYNFKPDAMRNQISFGLSCVTSVGKNLMSEVENMRPYASIEDFTSKIKVNKRSVLNLIKSGSFDSLYPEIDRTEIMAEYLKSTANLKNKLTLQNLNGLIEADLIPEELDFSKRVFHYTKVLKKLFKQGDDFLMTNESVLAFYEENFDTTLLTFKGDGFVINQKVFDKQIYQKEMDKVRAWLKKNHEEVLAAYNGLLFQQEWDKYAKGNVSSWEMESISFYHHEHELINVNQEKYGLVDFGNEPEEPEVDYFFRKNGIDIPIFKLSRIAGTVISKDKTRATINLLTTTGVATVRFRKEVFALYDKQLSERQDDGKKKIMEKSWFSKGNKLIVTGYRRDNQWVPKKYKNTSGHTVYKIQEVLDNGDLQIIGERYGSSEE